MTTDEVIEKLGPLQPGEYILLCDAASINAEQLERLGCENWVALGIHVHKLRVRDVNSVRLLRVEKAEPVKL